MPISTTADRQNQTPPRRGLLWASVTLWIIGALMLAANARHITRYNRHAVVIPLTLEAGTVHTASFTAEVDQPYDLELYARQDAAYDHVRKLVMPMDRPSELDIRWSIHHEGQPVAAGDCREYRHLLQQNDSYPARVAKIILNMPEHQPLFGPPTVARGVGRFNCKAGLKYDIRVQVGPGAEVLAEANPEIVATINRKFLNRRLNSTRWLSVGGAIACGLGFVMLAAWVTNKLRNRPRR